METFKRCVWHGMLALALVTGVLRGCAAPARETAIDTTLHALDVARDGFLTWDAEHQKAIVSEATGEKEATEELGKYRTERQKVIGGFSIAYTTVALASVTAGDERDRDLVTAGGYLLELYRTISELVKGK